MSSEDDKGLRPAEVETTSQENQKVMNEVKPPEYAPGDPNDPTAVLREIRGLLDAHRYGDAHGVLLRFRDHWAEVVAASPCGHEDSPNFTPDSLRELEARGFVRVNVPRRERATPVQASEGQIETPPKLSTDEACKAGEPIRSADGRFICGRCRGSGQGIPGKSTWCQRCGGDGTVHEASKAARDTAMPDARVADALDRLERMALGACRCRDSRDCVRGWAATLRAGLSVGAESQEKTR